MNSISYINWIETRNWLLLILAFVGGIITIRTYVHSVKQRKIDNTF
jgi:hypothetical protein